MHLRCCSFLKTTAQGNQCPLGVLSVDLIFVSVPYSRRPSAAPPPLYSCCSGAGPSRRRRRPAQSNRGQGDDGGHLTLAVGQNSRHHKVAGSHIENPSKTRGTVEVGTLSLPEHTAAAWTHARHKPTPTAL